jgi:hypothetical protein
MSRKQLGTLVTIVAAMLVVGCTKSEDPPAAAATKTNVEGAKPGADMKGVSADQVQVTTDGANADKNTGSALKTGDGK